MKEFIPNDSCEIDCKLINLFHEHLITESLVSDILLSSIFRYLKIPIYLFFS